ncbi:MAG: hypothetical protein GC131_08690 [Alphaproteobacteria bacterium]|nr:hypothetical protein [Alphaproteobacteria bacterium]
MTRRAIIRAALPGWPVLDAPARDAVCGDIAAYIDAALARAPFYTRAAICTLDILFALFSLFRPATPALLERWENAWQPARMHVRFYRTLALLAWCDDGRVQALWERAA